MKYDLPDDEPAPESHQPTKQQIIDRTAERIWMLAKLNRTSLDSERMVNRIREITEELIKVYVDELAEERISHSETKLKLKEVRAEMRRAEMKRRKQGQTVVVPTKLDA